LIAADSSSATYFLRMLSILRQAFSHAAASRVDAYDRVLVYLRGDAPCCQKLIYTSLVEEVKRHIATLAFIPQQEQQLQKLVSILQLLHAPWALEQMADLLLVYCVTSGLDPAPFAAMHPQLIEKLFSQFYGALQKRDLLQLNQLHHAFIAFGVSDEKLGLLTFEVVMKALAEGREELSSSDPLLQFWRSLNLPDKKPYAENLYLLAQKTWGQLGQEKRALALLELALSISQFDGQLMKKSEKLLCLLFREAENCNLIERLFWIYDAMQRLGIPCPFSLTPTQIANYLADAQYLYEARRYEYAKLCAGWVLRFEPNNAKALRLFGLSCFQLGDYQRAQKTLVLLTHPDEAVRSTLNCVEASRK
jgi:tetratricopeptide (TPR) repeat protein